MLDLVQFWCHNASSCARFTHEVMPKRGEISVDTAAPRSKSRYAMRRLPIRLAGAAPVPGQAQPSHHGRGSPMKRLSEMNGVTLCVPALIGILLWNTRVIVAAGRADL